MAQRFEFTVKAEHSGKRLDQTIAAQVTNLSRTKSKKVLAEGGVFVDKKRVKVAGRLLSEGQRVVIHYNESLLTQPEHDEKWEIPIIAQDANLLIVDKPSGLFSAPTPESDQNDLMYLLSQRLELAGERSELHVVHRLDRPTSGLLMIARNRAMAAELGKKLEAHEIARDYLALMANPPEDRATLKTPIDGREACTHFSVLERRGSIALVEARLETGRTHQVRIHAEAWGSPILGDSKYGRATLRTLTSSDGERLPPVRRLALHAFRLEIPQRSGQTLRYESKLPDLLQSYFDQLPKSPKERLGSAVS